MRACLLLLGLVAAAVDGFVLAGSARPVVTQQRASPVTAAETAESQCALIDLSTNDPIRLANVLKSAWMEGGVKRGLSGTVLVPEENLVRIVCSGSEERLRSFAEWLETTSMLVTSVKVIEMDECPTDAPMTTKFPIAPAEGADGVPEWRELVTKATLDVSAAQGKTHSSDEGLA